MRFRGVLAFGGLLACYSGLTSLEPFPCADDHTCPSGLLCQNNQCVCPTKCGDTCVDTTSDTSNCGACGTVCPTGGTCSGSACSCGTLTDCTSSNSCADLTSDTNNCGACGATCPTSCVGKKCSNACTLFGNECPSGQTCYLNPSDTLWATTCRALGSSAIGEPCTHGNDCAAGLGCFAQNNVTWCWQLCDATHPCPNSATCHQNANIPNAGGYCTTASACSQANFTVQCTGVDGAFTCPVNSTCSSTTSQPKECNCAAGYAAFNCQNATCANGGCPAGTPWWCD
jgi:hypothetical protein